MRVTALRAHSILLLLFITLLALWLPMAPGARAAGGGRGQLTIGISQFPSNFHPMIDSTLARTYILGMAQRPVTAYDAEWNLACLLCEELPTMENGGAVIEQHADGGKGIAVTYTIPEAAQWGDGTPITVDDVLFTWEVGKHPDSGITNFEFFRNDIQNITVEGKRRFTLHMDKITCEFAAINDFFLLPAHLEKPVFEADPKAYAQRTLYDTDTTNPGLYWGPYRISRVEQGSAVVLERNPKWWGKRPAFDRIVVKTIGNTAALSANLLSGGIDMISGELGMSLDEALAFEKRAGQRFRFVYRPGLVYEHIDLNLNDPVLRDVRVRQALLLALDRQQINDRLFAGRQPVATTSVNPLDSVFDAAIPMQHADPARAGELLDQAGWKRGSDGMRRNAEGKPLSLGFSTTAGNATRELVQQVLQQQWRAVGIDTTINNQTARVFFGDSVRHRKFGDMALFAWISSPRSVPRTTLHSSMIPTEANNWAGQNYTGYKNPEMDQVLEDLEDTCEPRANQALWNRLQELYARDLPALPLYFRAEPYILPAWLEGLKPTGHQYPSSFWVEDWHPA